MDLHNIILLATEAAQHAAESGAAAAAAETVHETADPGLLGTFGLNGKLFLAQLVNFLIVLFVLWKWVFGPIGKALENRREKVETSLKEAKEIEQRVERFETEHEERIRKSRAEAEGIIQKAGKTASEMKTQGAVEANQEAERIINSAKQTIEAEKEKAITEVREQLADLTLLATEKVLNEKLDEEQDKKLVRDMLKNISN